MTNESLSEMYKTQTVWFYSVKIQVLSKTKNQEHNTIVTNMNISESYPIIHCPADILKVAVIQKHGWVALHPDTDLCHTYTPDVRLRIPV